jgi:D-aminopeptidase
VDRLEVGKRQRGQDGDNREGNRQRQVQGRRATRDEDKENLLGGVRGGRQRVRRKDREPLELRDALVDQLRCRERGADEQTLDDRIVPRCDVPSKAVPMPRVRDYLSIGILPPGPLSAITDIAGVRVGHASVREGGLRTGVTAVVPHGGNLYRRKVTAASAVLNGYGKSIGLMQIDELGTVETPILLTSTLNVARVADALISHMFAQDPVIGVSETVNPVVLECFDGYLSDARARAVGQAEVLGALAAASAGPVATGCVGAGVGMRCLGFKSGIGTASRLLPEAGWRLGLLVVPNFGFAGDLIVAGAAVGRLLAAAGQPPERGSCVFVVATDAPLDAGELRRLAWRCFLGMARTGAISGVTSGDLAVAFSTSPERVPQDRAVINLLFRAVVECAEEAILDALFGAETTTGRDGHVIPALPVAQTLEILRRHGVSVVRPEPAL